MANAPQTTRYNFTAATKRVIAERANNQCVVPGCKIPTTGPGAKPTQSSRTGIACHIYSAAQNGPRGQAGLTPAQIKDATNGVWGCSLHGDLIDNNDGLAYPAALLQGWKTLQEAMIKKARDHQDVAAGWVDKITIQNCWLFSHDATLTLGRATLLQGGSYGKTAICDWIATALGDTSVTRWMIEDETVHTSIEAYVPEAKRVDAILERSRTDISINGIKVSQPRMSLSAIYLREDVLQRLNGRELEDDEFIATALNVDRTVVRSLVTDVQRNGTINNRDLKFFDEPKYIGEDAQGNSLYSPSETEVILRRGGKSGTVFRGFSGSEHWLVLLDFACALARERTLQGSALLILDANAWSLDQGNIDACGDYLGKQPFQTLMTWWGGWQPAQKDNWWNWSHYELVRKNSKKGDLIATSW